MEREKLIATVSAAQNGDGDALNELFNAFYNDVYYFALKTVKDDDLACDITQETFVEIINTIGDLHEPAAFVKWMKQITYHQCTRYFKKKKDILVDEDEEGNTVFDTLKEEKAEFIPDEALDQQDFRDTILAMLDELSEEQRSATMLYYYDEMSVKQIAEIQNVSEGTVKSRLNYARKSIKSSVETYEKKNGVKLHCAGVLPLMLWLLSQTGKETMPAAAANAVAGGVTAATGVAVSAAASAGGAAVATAAVATTTASGVGIAAKITALPVIAKVIAGVVAGSLVIGGIGMAVLPENDPAPTDPIVTTVPSGTSPTQTEISQPSTEETLPSEATVPTTDNTEATEATTEPIETQPITGATEPIETLPATNTTEPTEPSNTTASRNYVPIGCTYTTADGTILNAGEAMPETVSEGDIFTTEDYTYTYSSGGWAVQVNDTTKTAYSSLLSAVNDAPVTSMRKAFAGCSNLTYAPEIPGTIQNMQSAFFDCTSLTAAPTIPEGVTNLSNTFSYCASLTTAPTIPEGVTDMSSAFWGCTSLTTAPVIPESVTDITWMFYGCTSLTAASAIPEGVTDMSYTFSGCTSLATAPVIPESVTNMFETFGNCTSLTAAPVIPESVTNMSNTFWGCTSLTTAPIIPESVTNMVCTFSDCTSLTTAPVIPEGVTDLDNTFRGCTSLTTAPIIPESVTNMVCTFSDCTSLTTAPVIPEGVTDLYRTFRGCTSLTSAPVIPESVTGISELFYGCTSLTGIVEIHANPTDYELCFAYTQQPITLTGSSTMLSQLAATATSGNVTVQLAE